jgi:hypothetical protein
MKAIVVPTRETYNEKWAKYLKGRKDEHYKQDSCYIIGKVNTSRMYMQITALVEVTRFRQSNRYIFGIMLFTISVIERGTVNWVEWFKVRLHKEMIM